MNKVKQLNKDYRKDRIQKMLSKSFFVKNKKKKIEEYIVKNNLAPEISSLTKNIAFVIDGEVVDIIHCQERLAAILLSNPEIVDIEKGQFPRIGWKYEDGVFSSMDDEN